MTNLEIQQARLNEIVYRPNFEPVAVVLEGRDTAGKSGTIRELTLLTCRQVQCQSFCKTKCRDNGELAWLLGK